MAAKLVTIFWRDIPAQVNAQQRRDRARFILEDRFQKAIDRAAMVAGITDADDYVAEWRQEATPCGTELETEAETAAKALEADYPPERVKAIADNGGWDPTKNDSGAP